MNRINDIDLATLGAFILRGGDDTFLRFPERKEPPQNEWFEEDGLDVDLTNVLFEPLKVELILLIKGANIAQFNNRLNDIETLLYSSGTKSIYIGDLDRTYTARFTGITDYKHRSGLYRSGEKACQLTASFILDNPAQAFTPDRLTLSGGRTPTHIELNGVDLGDYGMIVQHLYDTAIPKGKPQLGIAEEYDHLDGAIADTAFTPTEQSRQLELIASMTAAHRGLFWQNYTALFTQMRQYGALTVDIPHRPSISCYYQSMPEIKKLRALGISPRVQFTIKLKTI